MICIICHRKYKNIDNLIIHMKAIHPYEQSYQCGSSKCFRKYTNIASLKKHLNVSHKDCFSNDVSFKLNTRVTNFFITDEASSSNNTNILAIDVNRHSESNVRTKDTSEVNRESESDVRSNDRNVMYVQMIDDVILKFIAKLYSNSSLTRNIVQNLVEDCSEMVQDILSYIKCKLQSETSFSNDNVSKILDTVFESMRPFEKYCTEYRRLTFFQQSKWLIQPQKFYIGEMLDSNRDKNNVTIITTRRCEGQFIPLRESLKQYLELPGVFMSIKSYIAQESANENTISSIFCGNVWKNLVMRFDNNNGSKILLPLLLYYDDFETRNPLGSRSSVHKLGGLYYTIAGIPTAYASSLENIFLGELLYSTDREIFGNKMSFTPIINELKYLENFGITICVDDKEYQIVFSLLALLGDNLGLNDLLGYNKSFAANFCCRVCRASQLELKSQYEENIKLLRTVSNYEEDCKNFSYGIKETCVFNELSNFHCVTNAAFDVMHDLYEGVCRYDMAKIINALIQEKYFSLKLLNSRLQYFNHKCNIDIGNSVPPINEHHLKQGFLVMSSSEMSALVTYFGIVIGDKVLEDDPYWQLYLLVIEIIHIVTSFENNLEELHLLQRLITDHHKLYVELFHEPLKPKFHNLLHYARKIEDFGPLRYLSSIRFEAFHKPLKINARLVTSRINIVFTLSLNLQLKFAYRIFSKKGFNPKIDCGKYICDISSLSEYRFIKHSIESDDYYIISWVTINGFTYKPKLAFCLGANEFSEPQFGIITYVATNNAKQFCVIYNSCETIGLDSHKYAYEISLGNTNIGIVRLNLDDLFVTRSINNTADGSKLITKFV